VLPRCQLLPALLPDCLIAFRIEPPCRHVCCPVPVTVVLLCWLPPRLLPGCRLLSGCQAASVPLLFGQVALCPCISSDARLQCCCCHYRLIWLTIRHCAFRLCCGRLSIVMLLWLLFIYRVLITLRN
jgi:hypothetical protein